MHKKWFESPLFWQTLIPLLLVVLIPLGIVLAMGWFSANQAAQHIEAGGEEATVQTALTTLQRFTALIAILTILAVGFVAFLLYQRVVEPLQILESAARAVEKDHPRTGNLSNITRRRDEFGSLARTFEEMASTVTDRETRLRQEVTRLTIHIDTIQKQDAVERIVSSDFFTRIQEKARLMRFRRSLGEKNGSSQEEQKDL
jgi:nitrogen fixation/metabolism regulation signal transduction histidine kinase